MDAGISPCRMQAGWATRPPQPDPDGRLRGGREHLCRTSVNGRTA